MKRYCPACLDHWAATKVDTRWRIHPRCWVALVRAYCS